MDDNKTVNYNIDDNDIRLHAPIVYNAIQEYYVRIGRLIKSLNVISGSNQSVNYNPNIFGILPNKEIKYEDSYLKNDEFKISVIYHLCMSNMMGCVLSWEAYLHLSMICHKAFYEASSENLSSESIMLKFFKVDPRVIPKSFLNNTMKLDEFTKATEFIIKKVKKLKSYENQEFNEYDEYFEYMEKEARKIIKDCHKNDFYNTHDLDRFTCACITNRMDMSLPILDTFYDVPGILPPYKVDIESVKKIQKKILSDKL